MRFTTITSASRVLENEVEPECTIITTVVVLHTIPSTRIIQKDIEDLIFSHCLCDLGNRM